MSAGPVAGDGLRVEIQALRALAVSIVVVCHFWPSALPGGFVGVDVFFVISGFLITSHLLREVDRTGTVSLPAFWARRARRILPAAFLTLAVCAVATLLLAGQEHWRGYLSEVRAGTAYVENWYLAGTATDYFAADDAPSPVRHFWSLSAEEQFYLLWPVLIVAALALPWWRRPRPRRAALAAVLGLVTLGSLAWSIHLTRADPAAAYYVTPTRAWEFGTGGLLALVPARALPAAAASLLSWAGIAAIALAAATFGEATAFPGHAALLPVAGTLVAIYAGAPRWRWAPTRGMSLPPVRLVGDVSYSMYLWHWPLLVFAPLALDRRLTDGQKLALVGLTVLAGWASKVLVEDPFRRRSAFARRRPAWTFGFVAAGTGIVLAMASAGLSLDAQRVQEARRAAAEVLAARPTCLGAAARDPALDCAARVPRMRVVPAPVLATQLPNGPCEDAGRLAGQKICAVGVPAGRADATVALVGDSHTTHWREGLDRVGRARRWRVLQLAHQGCQLSMATKVLPEPRFSSCLRWKARVLRWLEGHPEVHTVLLSQLSHGTGVRPAGGRGPFETEVDGYVRAFRALPRSVRQVVVIRDNPKVLPGTLSCVQRAIDRRRTPDAACAVSRAVALAPDPAAIAARRMRSHRFAVVDLTPFFCDRHRCHVVIGGALVHQDESHMTAVFNATLAPYLQRELDKLLSPRR